MNKFLPLLLCLLLSVFTVARVTKPAHTPAPGARSAQKKPTGQETDEKTLLTDANTGEEVPSDGDDNTEPASSGDGEDVNDDGGGDVSGDQETGDNDAGDDNGDNDDSGDEGE